MEFDLVYERTIRVGAYYPVLFITSVLPPFYDPSFFLA